MNPHSSTTSEVAPETRQEEPRPEAAPTRIGDLLDLVLVLTAGKRTILLVTLAAAVLAALISLLIPNTYKARARILPPQQTQTSAALLNQLGTFAELAARDLSVRHQSELYSAMLRSRTVGAALLERFGLMQEWDESRQEMALARLEQQTSVTPDRNGIITVEYYDRSPQRAAEIANAYIQELSKLTQTLAVSEAGQRRLFFEQQLKRSRDDLTEAELELKATQETTGLIQPEPQTRAIVESLATLRGQIAAKEVEIRAVRSFAADQNPDLKRLQAELAGLREQLARLQTGSGGGKGDVLLPTGAVPERSLEYLRRLREVKYHEAVTDLLARQYELARVEESKHAVVIQVLDPAVPPERKHQPKRTLIVMVTTILALFFSSLVLLLGAFYRRLEEDPEASYKLQRVRRDLTFRRKG